MAGMIGGITNMAMGTVGTIFNAISGVKTDKKLQKLEGQDPVYSESPYVKQQLGLAQSLINARMPGGVQQERNIYRNQANSLGNIQRNATDSSQLLAMGAASQGQTNQALSDLGVTEAQDYYNRLGNLNQAQGVANEEHRNVFDDKVRRWQDQVNILMARYAMQQKGGQDISNLGGSFGSSMQGMGAGGGGGMGGMMGG